MKRNPNFGGLRFPSSFEMKHTETWGSKGRFVHRRETHARNLSCFALQAKTKQTLFAAPSGGVT